MWWSQEQMRERFMMRLRYWVVWTRLLLILPPMLAGCTSALPPPLKMEDPKYSMIFGNVQSGVMITQVKLHEYGAVYLPPFHTPPKVHVYPNGDFIAENLEPGKYYLSGFQSSDLRDFSLASLKLKPFQRVIWIKPGTLHYVGSYKLSGPLVLDKKAKDDEFFIRKVRLPGERDILRRIYQITEGTAWQNRIDKRLKELRHPL